MSLRLPPSILLAAASAQSSSSTSTSTPADMIDMTDWSENEECDPDGDVLGAETGSPVIKNFPQRWLRSYMGWSNEDV